MLMLASTSATRKTLLARAGLAFTCQPAPIDERMLEAGAKRDGLTPGEIALTLAKAKALSVSQTIPQATVIGADQVLALGDEQFHKPRSIDEAKSQLDRLRGKSHTLHAGLALARGGQILWSHLESAELTMRNFSNAERDAVLAIEGDAVLGSVGAYRLEGPSIQLFDGIKGDYFTILGLPLLPLLAALRLHEPDCF